MRTLGRSVRSWGTVSLAAGVLLLACAESEEREPGDALSSSSSGHASSSGDVSGSSGAASGGTASSSSGGSSSGGASSGGGSSSGGASSSSGGSSSGALPVGTSLTVAPEVSGVASLHVLAPEERDLQAIPRGSLPGCPAILSPSRSSEFEYVELKNDSDRAVQVEVDLSAGSYDLYVSAYPARPVSDAEREACLTGKNCFNGRDCLTGERKVTIAAHGSVQLYLTPVVEGAWPSDLVVRVRTVASL